MEKNIPNANGKKQDTPRKPFLPKNLRQIGELDKDCKVYIEDYVIIYLKQMSNKQDNISRLAVLYGETYCIHDVHYYYIFGAACSLKQCYEEGDIFFEAQDEEYFGCIKEKYFSKSQIIGWALLDNSFTSLSVENIWKNRENSMFQNKDSIFYSIHSENQTETLCQYSNSFPHVISGYYIFYDKNEEMQNFLIAWHEEKKDGTGELVRDVAIRQFRSTVMEKEELSKQKRTMSFFYLASSTLMVILCVIGITMLNHYDKMKQMEVAMEYLVMSMNEEALLASNEQVIQESVVLPEQEISEQASSIEMEEENRKKAEEMQSESKETQEVTASTEVNNTEKQEPQEQETQNQEPQKEKQQVQEPQKEEQQVQEPQKEEIQVQETAGDVSQDKNQTYAIQKGDTLTKISIKFYQTSKRVKDICLENQITNPDSIEVGQKIRLP